MQLSSLKWSILAAAGIAASAPTFAQCTPPATVNGPDVIVGDIPTTVANYANVGTIDAFSFGTTSCNIGNVWLNWIASTNQHPVIGQSMYKLKRMPDGSTRFEQIGQSWLKHGFFALSQNLCCSNCSSTDGSHLGVHCSDPYTASRNGGQSNAGPKWQVNAATGVFTYPPANPAWNGSVARRLQVKAEDLEVSSTNVLYFIEAQYVTNDDAAAGNKNNNASYRQVTMSGSGSSWTAGITGTTQRTMQGVRAWAASANTVSVKDVEVDGLILLAYQVTDIGNGQWHYEYVVQNMNSDRSVGAVAFTCPPGVTITNIGFNDVDYHSGDGIGSQNFSGTDWANSIGGGEISWSTEAYATNQSANAIRWGTSYTFRFDANTPPGPGTATLTLFKPGTPTSATITGISTPTAPPEPNPGDVDGDGDVDLADLAALLASYGQCAGDGGYNAAADFDDSGCVDLGDLSILLSNYGG